VKTHDSIRPTIGNPSWFWRAAALVALVGLLASIGLARLTQPVAQMPAANPSALFSSGSAHAGSAYVEYLLYGPYETAPSAVPNQSMSTAQDRSSYGSMANAEYIEYLTGRSLRGPAQPASSQP
jgi:hypothetical protein